MLLKGRELDRKINYQGLMKTETEEMSVLTKTIEEKTVRQKSLAADVREMKSERTEAESTLLADGELASKLDGSFAVQAFVWEERQKLRAEGLLASRGTIKMLNDDGSLKLFKETLQSTTLIQLRNNKKREVARRARSLLTNSPWVATRQLDIHGPQ